MKNVLVFVVISGWCALETFGQDDPVCSPISISNITEVPEYPSIYTLSCSCTATTGDPLCPLIVTNREDVLSITSQNKTEDKTCTTTFYITEKVDVDRPRLQALLACKADTQLTNYTELIIQKVGNGGNCSMDMDCWSRDQTCNTEKKCACASEAVYVNDLNRCLPVSGFGEKCEYNEQCSRENALCNEDDRCVCADGLVLVSDHVCVNSTTIHVTNLTMTSEINTSLPSVPVTVNCSCEVDPNNTPTCPFLIVKESMEKIRSDQVYSSGVENRTCWSSWNITAASFPDKPRMQVLVACACGTNSTEYQSITFQQAEHSGTCNEDRDCGGEDQICTGNKCSCASGSRPVFVNETNECYTAAQLSARCEYDEQCSFRNPNSQCLNDLCKCSDGYKPGTGDKCDKVGSSSSWVSPSISMLTVTFVLGLAGRATAF